MPLSDLFKKSSKKEPAQVSQKQPVKPSDDPSFFSPEMQKKRYEAAMEFLKAFQERMPLVGGKPHAGTVLAVAARLAGTSLYRSLNYKKDVAPGTVVLSEEVNKALPQLMNLFAYYCKENGIDLMGKPAVRVFPEEDKPRMTVEEVRQIYQDQYNAVIKKYGLNYLDGARAGMVLCSLIFQYHCVAAKDIDPYVAAGIVARGIIEGAKTAPPPLESVSSSTAVSAPAGQNNQLAELLRKVAQNSIDGNGTRLVLGEGMIPMQESLSHGGKYILVHPEVEKQFKQNNIDPFLVYEAAMQMEIAARIPQIDFVGGNVDELLRAWSGKPEGQAPIHVRQALWLQANANRLGYEKRGNSWALKK